MTTTDTTAAGEASDERRLAHTADERDALLRAARRARARADRAIADRDQAVRELRAGGASLRTIAEAAGLTPEGVRVVCGARSAR